jgi:hypothetical protein
MSRTSRTFVAAAVAAGVVLMSGAAFAGTITGTVTYTGKVPTLKAIAMDADPNCAKKHTTPQPSDVLVLGDGNTMANILVRVTKGLAAGKTYPAPTTPVVMDQNGCHYEPHVIGIMEGQQLLIRIPTASCTTCTRSPRSTSRSTGRCRPRSRNPTRRSRKPRTSSR